MAEQNQTVHTIYTAEAQLKGAEADLRDFVNRIQSAMGQLDKTVGAAEARTMGMLRNFNKAMSTMDQAQRNLSRLAVNPDRGGARTRQDIKGEAASMAGDLHSYRKTVSRALAGTVLEIDSEIQKLDAAYARLSRNRRKNARELAETQAEIDRLTRSRTTLTSNPYVSSELSGARTVRAQNALKKNAADDRLATRAAEDLTRAKMRLMEVEAQLATLDARKGGRAPMMIKGLRTEREELDTLIRSYEALPAVVAKYNRGLAKNMGGELKTRDRATVTAAREHLRLEERSREIQEVLNRAQIGSLQIDQMQLANLRTELRMSEQLLSLHRQDAEVMARVATLRDRATAKQNGTDFDAAYREAQRDNRAFDRARDPDRAASRYLTQERLIANVEVERARLAGQRNRHSLEQIRLLDQELVRLRTSQAELLKINDIEARIASQRAKAAKNPAGGGGGGGVDPQRRMGARADLMGDYAALGALTYGGYAVSRYIIEDEKALAQFQAIASASNSETARLNTTLKALGTQTRFTNLELAEGATLLAQAGLSARDAEPALGSIANLATAAGVEFKQAADVMTSVSNIWGYNTSQMGQTADILTAALNQTKLGMDQMQLGIQYAGNTAVDAGVDFVELTSIMGGMAQAGIRSGSTIGTGLRTLLTNLMDPTEKTVATFERLGLSMTDVDVRTLGLTQVLTNLKQAGFTGADAMGAFEIRAASAFNAIANNLGTIQGLQTSLYEAGTAATANSVQMDTLSAKWITFSNSALALASSAFKPVIEVLKIFLDLGLGLTQMMSGMTPVMRGLAAAATIVVASMAVTRLAQAGGALLNIATGASAASAGMAGLAATSTAAGVAVRSIPFVGIAAAIAGVITVGLDLLGVFKSTADESDKLDGVINDLESQLMETETTIKSVSQAAENLRNRQISLKNSTEDLRRNVLEQTRQRFESLGLEINRGTDSVEDMIEALERLRVQLNREFESQLLTLADQIEARVLLLRDQANDYGGGLSGDQTREALNTFRGVTNRGAGADPNQVVGQAFGGRFNNIGRVLIGSSRLGEGGVSEETYRQEQASMRLYKTELTNRRDQLAADDKARDDLNKQIRALTTLLSLAAVPIGVLTNAAREQERADQVSQQARVTSYMTDGYTAGSMANSLINSEMTRLRGEVTRVQSSGQSAAERSKAIEDLYTEAQSWVFNVLEKTEDQLKQELKAQGISPEIIESLSSTAARELSLVFSGRQSLKEQAERLERGANRQNKSDTNDVEDIAKRTDKARVDLLSAELKEIEARIKVLIDSGASSDAIDALRKTWNDTNVALETAEARAAGTTLAATRAADRSGGIVIPTLTGGRTTSEFGMRTHPTRGGRRLHEGLDIAAPSGAAVPAAGGGRVVGAGWRNGYGNTVEIEHANGIRTLYAHLSRIAVTEGQDIIQNAIIGNVGSTGNSTGPHLHFAVKNRRGTFINPRTAITGSGVTDANMADLAQMGVAEASTNARRRELEFNTKLDKDLAKNEYEINKGALTARRKSIDTEIDLMVGNLAQTGDASTVLGEIINRIEDLTRENVTIGERLLMEDPGNAGRLTNQAFLQQLSDTRQELLEAGAEKINGAYDAYRELQARLNQEQAFATEQMMRQAGASGASEVTQWMLAQRQELEAHEAALADAAVAQEIYIDTLRRRAEVEAELARLRVVLTEAEAASDAGQITEARLAIAELEERLRRLNTNVAVAGQGVLGAARNVQNATPIQPLATGAASATAGSNIFENPAAGVVTAIEYYKKHSGVMVSAAENVVAGIQGAFGALAAGIEQSINQLADGSLTIKSLFSNILGGIFKEMQATAAKIAANYIMQMLLQMMMNRFLPAPAAGGGLDAQGRAMLNRPSDWTAQQGGAVPYRRFALGSGQPARDSVRALLEPGEVVMRKSAVDFVGKEDLLSMNSMGNRRISDAAGKIAMPAPKEKDEVNVWMVAPNQVPPPGPKDIIHVVGESISRGELRKLVKSVQVG